MQRIYERSAREPATRSDSVEQALSDSVDAAKTRIVEEVQSPTRQGWSHEARYAPAAVRDRFLAYLDARDWNNSLDMAANLTGCGNPLPTSTCGELGLPTGSTYGAAAKCVLAGDARQRSKRC